MKINLPSKSSPFLIITGDTHSVMPMLPDGCADTCFTDPPYGHNNNDGDLIHRLESALGRRKVSDAEKRPILQDGPEATPLFHLGLLQVRRLLNGCCCCCCCCGGGPDPQFARWSLIVDEVLQFVQMVVWDKGPMGLGWKYRRSYETVLVGMKRGAKLRWFDDSHKVENIIRPGGAIGKIIPKKCQHPTLKPTALAEFFIRLHSKPGDLVIDPWCGSGTTGLAAINTGRRFIGIELDPHWAKVARRRCAEALS